MTMLSLDEITIGDRVRKDMGDLQALADSMKQNGMILPVAVREDRLLIDGERRILAARLLGWTEITTAIGNPEKLLLAERDANTVRKDFTPTEAIAMGRQIEEEHRAKIAAQEHAQKSKASKMGVAARLGTSLLKEEAGPKPLGSTVTVVSKAVGMGASKYTQAKAVVAAAESDPTTFGDLPKQMDATGNVSSAHEEMKRRKGTMTNGRKARHPVHRKTHYPKPNREMSRAITSLDGICDCLEALKPQELDTDSRSGWAKSLSKFASRINRVARRIK